MFMRGVLALALVCGFTASAGAADKLKIGVLTTLSGPSGFNGTQTRDAMQLAVEHLGGKIGDLPVELLFEDDQQKPDAGVQIVNKFLRSDKVDLIVGATFSNITIAAYVPAVKAETVFISSIAGPSQIAGKGCSPYFFNTSWQGDNFAEAMGAYLDKEGKQNVYLMAPNYAAGHDVLTGFKRYFKGKIADEVYTPLDQLDFTPNLTQIRGADPGAIFAFEPSGLGIQFLKQFAESGLKDKYPLYTAYTVDNATLAGAGDTALGMITASLWNSELDNAANKRFVADFTKAYGNIPGFYAAGLYVNGQVVEAGLMKTGGDASNKEALIAALRGVSLTDTPRGPISFDDHGNVIGNIYIRRIEKQNGKLANKTIKTYEMVSQFWSYDPKWFLEQPVYSRDYPPLKA